MIFSPVFVQYYFSSPIFISGDKNTSLCRMETYPEALLSVSREIPLSDSGGGDITVRYSHNLESKLTTSNSRTTLYRPLSREEREDFFGRSMGTAPGGSIFGWGTICLIQFTTLEQRGETLSLTCLLVPHQQWCVRGSYRTDQGAALCTHLGGNCSFTLSTSKSSSSDGISTTGTCGRGS